MRSQLQQKGTSARTRARLRGVQRTNRHAPELIAASAHRKMSPTTRWFARSLELFTLASFVALFFIVPAGATPWVLAANLVTFYALIFRAIVVPDRILPWLPSYFCIEVLFFGFSYLIFYHQYQLYLLGATDLSKSVYFPDAFADGSNKAITLATVGMLAFTLGYRVLGKAEYVRATEGDQSRRERSALRYFHVMSIASSVLLLALAGLYLLAGWRSANEGRYTGTTTEGVGSEGTFMLIWMFCMIVAALWIYATATGIRRPPMLAVGLVIAIAWSLRMLVFGQRTSFMLIALVLVGGYFTFVRRAPLILLVAAFGVWMFIYRLIEVVRFIPNWYANANFWELLPTSPTYQLESSESGLNITTVGLRATVEMVPDNYDFMYGVLKLNQLAGIIPFSGKLYLPQLDPAYTISADLLSDIMIGPWATWGPGSNIISDSYIDFGVPGVVLVLFAIGLSAKAIRNYVARDPYNAHRVVMYLLTMALFALLPRYAPDTALRIMAWALIFSMLMAAISRRLRTADPSPTITGKDLPQTKARSSVAD